MIRKTLRNAPIFAVRYDKTRLTTMPVLVLGWHYKYQELLGLYSQSRWLINQDECDSKKLLDMFREFWRQREKNRQTILAQYHTVRSKVISEGRKMYGGKK